MNITPNLLLVDPEKADMRKKIDATPEQIAALQEQLKAKNSDENETE